MRESRSVPTARCVVLAALVVGWSAGQASASWFTLDKYNALLLHQISVSSSDTGALAMVTDDAAVYGGPMQGTVGYYGWLWDHGDPDALASMKIGAAGTPALGNINAAGSYDGVALFMANDDDDTWAFQLYMDAGGTPYTSSLTTLAPGASTNLTLSFGNPVDFATVTDLGFGVQAAFVAGGSPSNPDFFHVSTSPIPAPGALALVLCGLGVGLNWRKGLRSR